jgi:Domain of unknown function (DUF1995)
LLFPGHLKSAKEDNLDDLRRLLEASWNADTMGAVPTNPEMAAREATVSLKSARENGQSLFFVDLLLPSYDITQGPTMYDDVLAVEFCIALSKALEDKTCILVRDENTLKSVSRILDARERDRRRDDEEFMEDDDDDDEDDEEDDENIDVVFYDDFADFRSIGDGEVAVSTTKGDAAMPAGDDVDVFREQLLASWNSTKAEGQSDTGTEKPQNAAPRELNFKTTSKKNKMNPSAPKMGRLYRLASLFGDATISSGPDMIDQAIKAVTANAQPTEDEETIIILSAVTKEEMIAVRSLVAKYRRKKNIVLVNCQLDPLPRELISATTVYSILPLVAKPVVSERNVVGKPEEIKGEAPPKVVVLRRYPKEWEVYVDASGGGFELADTAPASQVGKKGPRMEWIAGCVKRHLQSKLGG